ncbi:hypothetical protein C5688_12695 [Methylocystis sp. MitZ-2018]|nr:hypothetical protein C5688_12695 [Methylocystis sp. MitZ-2018]
MGQRQALIRARPRLEAKLQSAVFSATPIFDVSHSIQRPNDARLCADSGEPWRLPAKLEAAASLVSSKKDCAP